MTATRRNSELPPAVRRWLAVLGHRHLPRGAAACWLHELALGPVRPLEAVDVGLVVWPAGGAATSLAAREFQRLGIEPEFLGRARSEPRLSAPDLGVAVLRGSTPPRVTPAPDDFRAVAIIPAYNEADVIGSTVTHLVEQGLEILLVDNWSTDDTIPIAVAAAGSRLVGVEKFPADGPSDRTNLREMLRRIEEIARDLAPAWIIRNDADEQRWTPWPDVRLVDALHHVEQTGCTAVNHTLLNFQLTHDRFSSGSDPRAAFRFYEAGRGGDLSQLNCWQQGEDLVDLRSSGGHTVQFEGLRVFPYNFALFHYPLRSLEQARRKVFAERRQRWDKKEFEEGWHHHYDGLAESDLLVDPVAFREMDNQFWTDLIVERLSGVTFHEELRPYGWRHRLAAGLARAGVLTQVLDARDRIRTRSRP